MKPKLWIALVLLMSASLACSLVGGTTGAPEPEGGAATQTPAEAGAATQTPAEAEAATEEAPSPEVAPDALSGLDSYRARWTAQQTPEGGNPEITVMEQERTRDPEAYRMTMEGGEGTFEYVRIGDTAWYCFDGTCAQSQMSEEEAISDLGMGVSFDPDDFITSDYSYIGRETINGIRTRHYTLGLTVAEIALMAQGEITDVQGDVWVADESGLPAFVVRYVMSWKETQEEQESTAEYSYEVYDVNAPITIEPPEGAAGLPEDVPVYPDATDLVSMEGLATFSTPDDVATVVDFYRTELAAQGWTNESDEDLAGTVSQVWNKEGRTLNLMISPGEEGGSSVMITLE